MEGLKIATGRLQKLVGVAAKGASNNRLIPLTSMLSIEFNNNELHLMTYDSVNTLHVWTDKVEGNEPFTAVVEVDLFSKLVSKTTSDFVRISVNENSLKFSGNGNHRIALVVDENGPVVFPKPDFEPNTGITGIISVEGVREILQTNKSSLSNSIEYPQLGAYYCGECAITTNSGMICISNVSLFDEDYLLSPETVELLALADNEELRYEAHQDGYMCFSGQGFILFTQEHEGKEDFPKDQVMEYADIEFPAHCKVSKNTLGNVFDRLNLFIEPYDKNGAYLSFTEQGILVESKKSTSQETIEYIGEQPTEYFKCFVDISMLKQLVKSTPSEYVDIYYGLDSCIKLESENAMLILALLVEEEGDF